MHMRYIIHIHFLAFAAIFIGLIGLVGLISLISPIRLIGPISFIRPIPTAEASLGAGNSPLMSLNSGLVGYWTFDGQDTNWATGQVFDRSGNKNTGTLTNMSTSTSPAIGKFGQAFRFDGVNDYVDITGNPSSLQITSNLTISAWVKARSFPNGDDNYIVTKTSGIGEVAYKLGATIDNAVEQFSIAVSVDGTSLARRYTSTTIKADQYYHVVGVYDASSQTLNIYINGALNNGTLAGAAVPASIFNSSGDVLLGKYEADPSRNFNGLIDDVRIYNRALSATEIRQLYNMGR